ncbi:ATP-binding protein [Burkholderia ambifaria]|jgi:hypothetical protein|uniref:ATP-binding protein n=1 Tax=Burkholderia ambifaria TaxID=152480 RepID=UPI001B9EF160|nr:ATP-binding protein [Burkholderia ambifaria]MBR8225437.1 ATP-binding protein [Burkholderia ambifaria]
MREIDHPPDAPSLLESMRSIGYSLESALADLLDNSITAKATNIRIEFRPTGDPYIAVLDDGEGMSSSQLESAMRHGSRNPLETRSTGDLGRYGLGLKTASLSQCQRMTVVSLRGTELSACVWDLETVVRRSAWTMLILDPDEIEALPHVQDLKAQGTGTMVIWQKLDRLGAGESSIERALGEKIDRARNHLALVFHRYISGEAPIGRIRIQINGSNVDAFDPFLSGHKGIQRLDEDRFTLEGHRVVVKPFILPHLTKLARADIEALGGTEGLRNQQGFYVYRNLRLIIWGTWFRLAKKDELSKLARVRVDIPNSLDHLWTLDIKKSSASPPEAVRLNLRRTVQRIRDYSGQTITFRGRMADTRHITPAWTEVLDRDGVRYDVNRLHPSVVQLQNLLSAEERPSLEAMLRVIEMAFPADALYARMASEMRPSFNGDDVIDQLAELARTLISGLSAGSPTRKTILDNLYLIEPFSAHPEVAKKISTELDENEYKTSN